MQKSPVQKFLVWIIVIFFILTTVLTFIFYLATPKTIDTEKHNQMLQKSNQEQSGYEEESMRTSIHTGSTKNQ